MTGSCRRLLAVVSLIVAASAFLSAQDPISNRAVQTGGWTRPGETGRPVDPIGPPKRFPIGIGVGTLAGLNRAAGIIFSGRVTAVGRASPLDRNSSYTSVTFRVEHATRGAANGQVLTIHEWAGLWAHRERYRVGERLLLFLYPPSKLGLTSPVAGMAGKFSIDTAGRIRLNAENLSALSLEPMLGGRTIIPYAEFARSALRNDGERRP
jgi:hypothetical protein